MIVTLTLELKPATPSVQLPGAGDAIAVTVKFVAAGAGVAMDANELHELAPVTTRLLPYEPVQPAWPTVKLKVEPVPDGA